MYIDGDADIPVSVELSVNCSSVLPNDIIPLVLTPDLDLNITKDTKPALGKFIAVWTYILPRTTKSFIRTDLWLLLSKDDESFDDVEKKKLLK